LREEILRARGARSDLQPFGVLVEHRVNDMYEGLIAVEQAVAARQQVALQPSLTLVLAQHRVEHPAVRGQELVVLHDGGLHWRSVTSKRAPSRLDRVSSGPNTLKLRSCWFNFVTSRRNRPSTRVSWATTAPGKAR